MAANGPSQTTTTINQYFVHPIGSTTLARLKIPIPFFNIYVSEEHRGEFVTLILDEFSHDWNVKREGNRLTDGWREFAISHDLQVGDYVLFKHIRDSVFKVTTLGPSGSQIIYENNALSKTNNEAGSKAKNKEYMNMGDRSGRPKKKEPNGKRGAGNSSIPSKKAKKEKITTSTEINSFYRTVTKSNLEKNEVKFENGVPDEPRRQSTGSKCKALHRWRDFCEANNLGDRDLCKFRLSSTTGHVIFELVEPADDDENPPVRATPSVPHAVCKKEQTSVKREGHSFKTPGYKKSGIGTSSSHPSGRTTLGRGQSSKW